MPNTAKGYPYPAGTDPVAGTATAIQNLATAVDSKVGVSACGQVSMNLAAVGTTYNASVTFPAGRFSTIPRVSVCPQTIGPQNTLCSANSTTATGTIVYAHKAGGATGTQLVDWIAVQV